jgi:ATP-binding cassette subfamily C (CFTR/MRP) protein 1
MLETSLGAIARLRDFEIETKTEAKEGESFVPPEDWPTRGLVQIDHLTASYK